MSPDLSRKRALPRSVAFALAVALVPALPAHAAEEPLRRVLVCAGPDASMEVYLPERLVSGRGAASVDLAKPAIGAYTLDLSGAGKGKVLEWVRVSRADNGATIVVDQFTRGLKPTRIPVGGGTVDFDNRFGTKAECPMFNEDPEIE